MWLILAKNQYIRQTTQEMIQYRVTNPIIMLQSQALNILKIGLNVFLIGEPGAGKTYTIAEYVKYLRAHDIEPAITCVWPGPSPSIKAKG